MRKLKDMLVELATTDITEDHLTTVGEARDVLDELVEIVDRYESALVDASEVQDDLDYFVRKELMD